VHVVELNVPVLLDVNDTVPVGVIAPAPELSATVAVHVVFVDTFTEPGTQLMDVVVVLNVDARVKVPLLPECTESPPYVPVIRA
jgi:hypothetical protein